MIWDSCSLETFDQRKILRYLSYVCLSVRPSARPTVRVSVCGKHDCIRIQRATDLRLIRWFVLKMVYIGPQDLVPPI